MSNWKYEALRGRRDKPECDLCAWSAVWFHPTGGMRCRQCPRPDETVDPRIRVAAAVSDPPVPTTEDLARIDEQSRALSAAFRERTRSMDGDRDGSEDLRRRIRDLEAEQIAILAEHDEVLDQRNGLLYHLERVLAIVTEVGGYLSQEHQDAIRAAREAVR